MDWERARKPEQKAIRREAILRAARALFSELEYDEISLNGIAREAGISKPNVYRYFATREEIFLTIFAEEQNILLTSLTARLRKIRAKDRVTAISKAWVEESLKRETYLNLLPQLATSMERNSSVEQLVQFKTVAEGQLEELIGAFSQAHAGLTDESWLLVIQCGFSMMCGLWPLSNPGENVVEAMQHPAIHRTPWEFRSLMVQGLTALIRGFEQENEP